MENEELILKKSINNLQRFGKKQKAFKIVKKFCLLNKTQKEKPLSFLFNLIEEISPVLGSSKAQRGSKSLDLPKIIPIELQYKLGIRWFLKPLNKTKGDIQSNLKGLINEFRSKKGYAYNKRKKLYESMISSRPFLFILNYKHN